MSAKKRLLIASVSVTSESSRVIGGAVGDEVSRVLRECGSVNVELC